MLYRRTPSTQAGCDVKLSAALPCVQQYLGRPTTRASVLGHRSKLACLQEESYKSFAQKAMKELAGACPTSLCLTLHHYAEVLADTASQGPLSQMHNLMKQEYCGATRMVSRHDFQDGVRAMMVDKDKKPKWNPAELSQVSADVVKAIVEPLPKDLQLAWKEQLM